MTEGAAMACSSWQKPITALISIMLIITILVRQVLIILFLFLLWL